MTGSPPRSPLRETAGPTVPRSTAIGEAREPPAERAGTIREFHTGMALPFDLPAVSRGFASLTPAARDVGARASDLAAAALGTLCRSPVGLRGRPLPALPAPALAAVRLRIDLAALPAAAIVEVEPRLAAALLDLLAGGPGGSEATDGATPLEQAALELGALACLDALAALPEIEERIAPCLVRETAEPASPLCVDLAVALGATEGRARLFLPRAAVEALGEAPSLGDPLASAVVELSIRWGSAPLQPEEVASLAPGDVVLMDVPPAGRLHAVAPGGLRLAGAETDGGLAVEEIPMPDPNAACPVAVEVELARLPITLGELARLEPGAVLPLALDRRGTVALKLGERTLARGQLVDVEGSVGVRIDALVGAP